MSDFVKFVRWVRGMINKGNDIGSIRKFVNRIKDPERTTFNDISRVIGFCPGCDEPMIDGAFQGSCLGLSKVAFCCNNDVRYNSPIRKPFDKLWCRECCEDHVSCDDCEDRIHRDDFCGDCDRGLNCCCRCVTCQGCDERYRDSDSVCSECSRGYDCCSCNCDNDEHSGVQFFESPLKFHSSNKMEFKRNRSKRFIAAEIEVAKMGSDHADELVRTIRKWSGSVVQDGSLPDTGFEINTAPANGDQFVKEVGEICDSLSRGSAEVNTTCGLHVHVDARDFDFYSLKNLIRVYAAIENTLYNMVPASRKSSSYCVPCGEKYMSWINSSKNHKDDVRYAVIRAIYNTLNTKDKKGNKYDGARYNALNLHSFFFRKTVESRMFNGTVSKDKIVAWGKLWAYILDYAKAHSWNEICKALPMSMPTLYNTSASMGIENLLAIVGGDKEVKTFILDRIESHGDNNHKSVAKQMAGYPLLQVA